MQTVFSHVIQKRFSQVNEDVATDALAFILQFSDRARAGMMKLLRGLDPNLPDLTFKTQQIEGSIRPDMWGYADDGPRVYVESKFWAGLTDNQPGSYLAALAAYPGSTILLAVVPEAREHTVWREFGHRLTEAGVSTYEKEAPYGMVHCADTSSGPALAITSWAKLLAALEVEVADDQAARGDLTQLRALCDAADSDAFVPISASEVTDQRLPALIMQLVGIVQTTVEVAIADGSLTVGKLRPLASWNRIGRYAKFASEGGPGCWIGVHLDLWRRHGISPLWLVFTNDQWGRAGEARALLEPWAAREGVCTVWEGGAFHLALDIAAGEEKDLVVRRVADRLKDMAAELSVLEATGKEADGNT